MELPTTPAPRRKFRVLLLITCLLTALLAAGLLYRSRPSPPSTADLVYRVLREQTLTFCVVKAVNVQAAARSSTGGFVLGQREGMATLPARLYFGLDLTRLTPADIRVTEHAVVVRLPPITLLDAAVDLTGLQVLTKQTGLQKLKDLMTGDNLETELQHRLVSALKALADDPSARPDTRTVLAELQARVAPLMPAMPITFEFKTP